MQHFLEVQFVVQYFMQFACFPHAHMDFLWVLWCLSIVLNCPVNTQPLHYRTGPMKCLQGIMRKYAAKATFPPRKPKAILAGPGPHHSACATTVWLGRWCLSLTDLPVGQIHLLFNMYGSRRRDQTTKFCIEHFVLNCNKQQPQF